MSTYPTIVPYLVVPDGDAELAFLKLAFGGVVRECNLDGRVAHAEVEIGKSLVMVGQPPEVANSGKASIYLTVDDADRTYAEALNAGGKSDRPPADTHFRQRM